MKVWSRTSAGLLAMTAVGIGLVAGVGWRSLRPEARSVYAAPQQAVAQAPWLTGTPEQKFGRIEAQLRGLDVTMVEIGYRFTELYFGGKDRNWDYAKYQTEKIETALRLALERRPKRAKSAQPFLNETLPAVQKAIASRSPAGFNAAMDRLRTGCMKCHADEQVPFFTVEFPERRLSTIRTLR